MKNQIILSTNGLTKKYKKQTAVNQVSLNVRKGRIYGLLKRNGAGKTTIMKMKMLLGLTSILASEIKIFNKPLRTNEKSIYSRIGSIIETPGFYSKLTETENLRVFARLRGIINKRSIRNALAVVGLPYDDKSKVGCVKKFL